MQLHKRKMLFQKIDSLLSDFAWFFHATHELSISSPIKTNVISALTHQLFSIYHHLIYIKMLLPLIAKTNKIRQHKSKRKGKGDEEAEETEGRSVSRNNGFFFSGSLHPSSQGLSTAKILQWSNTVNHRSSLLIPSQHRNKCSAAEGEWGSCRVVTNSAAPCLSLSLWSHYKLTQYFSPIFSRYCSSQQKRYWKQQEPARGVRLQSGHCLGTWGGQ